MCTAIAKKGDDLIYGFNLDIDPDTWKFGLYKTNNYFTVGITAGRTLYFTHGVTADGNFGNVPYMNSDTFPVKKGAGRERIDLMTDRYIRGKYSFGDIENIAATKEIVCIPAAAMHSLVGNGSGDFLIIEPGFSNRRVNGDFAVITNFPVTAELSDYSNPFYGKDRYDKAYSVLRSSGRDFSAADALELLYSVRQEGRWATRISFVYSGNENAVYYFLNGDIKNVQVHSFKNGKRSQPAE